jgi:modification methylase
MQNLNKIILGDALKTLRKFQDAVFDVGVTSPPYNKQENKKGWLVKNVVYHGANDKKNEQEYQSNQIDVLNELYRVTKPGGSFFYNHKIRWERGELIHPYTWISKTDWTIRQEIIWDRMIAANIRGWRFWQVEERIYWLYKPVRGNKIGKELNSRHALLSSIWRFPPERKNDHPAPFPIELPVRCIFSILNGRSGTIIDPYVGSGTTAVAAKILGCNYIGIDLSERYVKESNLRIKNAESEKARVDAEIAKHFVNKTFSERKAEKKFTGRYSPQFLIGSNKLRDLELFPKTDSARTTHPKSRNLIFP